MLLGLLVLAAALGLRVHDPPLLQRARNEVFDSYQRFFPRNYDPTVPVRIVAIDEEALRRVGQWPWPRTDIADLIAKLTEFRVAATGLNILLADPDRSSPRAIVARLSRLESLEDLAARAANAPDGDITLAGTLRKATAVLPFTLSIAATPGEIKSKWGIAYTRLPDEAPTYPELPTYAGSVPSLPMLQAAAKGNGSINLEPDPDGTFRRAHLLLKRAGMVVPSLAAELLRISQAAGSYVVKMGGGQIEGVGIGGLQIATGSQGEVWLHLTGHEPSRFVSAAAVLSGEVDPSLLEGHIALIGMTAEGLRDLYPTALDRGTFGVELHAEIVEQLLLGATLVRPDWADGAELIYMALLGLALIRLLHRLPPIHGALVGAAAAANALAISLYAFHAYGLLLDSVFPSITVLLVYLVATGTGFAQTERDRRHVRKAFERYLAPAVVERVVEERDSLVLGGETREITLLFSDIRGFTTVAEKLDAQALTRMVNTFMTPMTEAILEAGGTVDKFMGDAIMAFWNAPLDDPDHPRNACLAALDMGRRMDGVNDRLRELQIIQPDATGLAVGIGLNTGACCVGNMGSEQRFDYSALGDPVNLASRLEGLCRQYSVDIVVGETTARSAGDLAFVELDLIKVKGKQRPERIFALLGDATLAASAGFQSLQAAQHDLLAAYRTLDLGAAEAALARVRELDGDRRLAGTSAMFAERLVTLRLTPPTEAWDGVFVAQSK